MGKGFEIGSNVVVGLETGLEIGPVILPGPGKSVFGGGNSFAFSKANKINKKIREIYFLVQ